MILYGMQRSMRDWNAFGSLEGLFGFRRAMTLDGTSLSGA